MAQIEAVKHEHVGRINCRQNPPSSIHSETMGYFAIRGGAFASSAAIAEINGFMK